MQRDRDRVGACRFCVAPKPRGGIPHEKEEEEEDRRTVGELRGVFGVRRGGGEVKSRLDLLVPGEIPHK